MLIITRICIIMMLTVLQFTGLDFEMVIRNHYHEVLEFSESLMIFIIRSLQERPEFQRLTKIVNQVYHGAGNFKLPPGDKAVRITFAEGVKMLKEAGIETGDCEDLRYTSVLRFLANFLPYLTNHPTAPPTKKPSAN